MASLQERLTVRARTARPRSQPETTGWKAKLAAAREALGRYAAGRVLLSVARGFVKDRVTASAAAMTYYGIFSLFPLILLFMSLAGLALQSNEAARSRSWTWSLGCCPRARIG
jgi:hypothetical protein